MKFGNKILLLVPHPDDEVVASCAALGRAQQNGAQIFALYLTHGCIAQTDMWPWARKNYAAHVQRRRTEAEIAAGFLELTPVGWSERPARQLWQNLPEAYAEITQAIQQHAIDQVWVPAYEGGHPDHDGLNAIGQKLKTLRSDNTHFVLEFAEYNNAGGKPHSQQFPAPNGTEQILTLTAAERQRKVEALRLYVSEQGNLNYVKTERECFRPLANYDYRQPPHPGILWYARFQWVPFKHPQVDFTNSEEVSKKISEFMAQLTGH